MKPRALLIFLLFILMTGALLAQGTTVTIGTGTSAQRQPFGVYYGYERDASLYMGYEIDVVGFISQLSWNVSTSSNTYVPYKIYLKNTTQTTMTASSWESMISGATLVKTNTALFSLTGYQTITLDTNFYADGQNLLVLVESNYGGTGTATYPSFRFTTTSTNLHQYWATDNTPPSGVGTLNVNRPNIQIFFPPAGATPVFYVTPTSVDFGSKAINATYFQDVTIQNQGTGTLVLNTVSLTGDGTFALIGSPSSAYPLTAGQSVTFQVRYTPTATGVTNGVIHIYNSVNYLTDIPITGTAIDPIVYSYPYLQSFDAVTFPPQFWANQALNGLTAFARVVSGSHPVCAPHSGEGMVIFNSFNAATGSTAMLVTPPFNVAAGNFENMFRFWMYRDAGYPTEGDKIEVYMNSTPDLIGSPQLMHTVYRNKTMSPVETGADGWYQYFVSPPVMPSPYVYFILKATGAYGNDIFLDDVSFDRTAVSPLPYPATLVMPADAATGVTLQPTLVWQPNAIGTTNGYRLNVGTDYPPTNIMLNYEMYNSTAYNFGANLAANSTYYWQVIPYNIDGFATGCPVWSFTTMSTPQENPANPLPADYSNDVSKRLRFSWDTTTDALYYRVYLGTNISDMPAVTQIPAPGTGRAETDVFDLVPNTMYYWKVQPGNVAGELDLADCILWQFSTGNEIEVNIGSDYAGSGLPIDPARGYTYSQTKYAPSEINFNGYINSISYFWNGVDNGTNSAYWVIWMGGTTDSTVVSETDWLPVSGMTQVYNGPVILSDSPGWVTIDLQVPYGYTMSQSLVVAVYENTPGGDSSDANFRSSFSAYPRSIAFSSDDINPIPAYPPSGNVSSMYPNIGIRFGFVPSPAVLVSPADGATNQPLSVTMDWEPGIGPSPTGYEVYFGTDNPPTTLLYSQVESWNITPALSPLTTYYWRVVPFNPEGGPAMNCPVWSFTTTNPVVPPQLTHYPTSYHFDDVAIGVTAGTPVTIKNTGGTSLTVETINMTGNVAFFTTDVPTLPYALAAGDSIVFTANFEPTTVGFQNAMLTFHASTSGADYNIPLSGNGIQNVSYPWSETFDSMPAGWSFPLSNWSLVSTAGGGSAIHSFISYNEMITPTLPINDNMAVSVTWNHDFGYNPYTGDDNRDSLKVYYTTDDVNWNPIWRVRNQHYDQDIYPGAGDFTTTRIILPNETMGQSIKLKFEVYHAAPGVYTTIDSVCVYYYYPTAPGEPVYPQPEISTVHVYTNTGLSWANTDYTEINTVAFGTNPGSLLGVYYGAPRDFLDITSIVGPLAGNTTYYWQVISGNNDSYTTPGPIWMFTTGTTGPDLDVMPTSMEFFITTPTPGGGDIVGPTDIWLSNIGNSALTINSLELPDFPFTVSSPTFPVVIMPGNTMAISPDYDFTTAGIYQDTLYVLSDDPASPRFPIPLTLTVEAYAYIYADPDPVSVTYTDLPYVDTPVTIYNSGTAPLDFSRHATSSAWITSLPASGRILPGDSLTVTMHILKDTLIYGTHTGALVLQTNASPYAIYSIEVDAILPPPPVLVEFIGAPLTGHAPLPVTFTDQTAFTSTMSNDYVTGWRWDFQNDGVVDSYVQNPVHIYTTNGQFTVSLTIITAFGAVYTETKTNYITITNQAPVVTAPIPPVTILEDHSTGIMNMLSYFSDPDGDFMTFTLSPNANFTWIINGPDVNITPIANWSGSHIFTVTCADLFGGSVTQPLSITVTPVNDAPLFDMNMSQYFIRNSHYTINFANLVDDVDNPDSELTLVIQNTSIPADIMVNYTPGIPGALTATFSAPLDWIGVNQFDITVNDNMGRAITVVHPVFTVLENFIVTMHFNLTANSGLTGQLVQYFDDSLGNADQWSWSFGDNTPIGTTKDAEHVYLQGGTYPVILTVTNLETGTFNSLTTSIFMDGTAFGGNLDGDFTWTDDTVNLMPGTVIDSTATIDMPGGGTVNILDSTAVFVYGEFNAEGVTFQGGGGNWQGFYFGNGNQRNESEFINCEFVDALNPITIDACDITLDGCTFTPADTTLGIDGTGITILGAASPTLNGLFLQNYKDGLQFNGDGSRTLSTPTLTNVRVRNSENTTRDRIVTNGIKFNGEASPSMTNVSVENYTTGLMFDNYGSRVLTTPTLTNVRIRNSENTTRGTTYGMTFVGDVSPTLNDVTIFGCTQGIVINGAAARTLTTPTLTNVRIRNSENTTRGTDVGIEVNDPALLTISNSDIEGFSTGLKIVNDGVRTLSTPTLTNVRIRNSENTTRQENTGILMSGDVSPQFRDLWIDDYTYGIQFDGNGAPARTLSTPTLTNVRVRNSENTTRVFSAGITLNNVDRILITDSEVTAYNLGISILNPTQARTLSTPTLTNVRVRNSENTTRDENVGILLGSGVAGRLENANVSEAGVGILIADGNRTILADNFVKNCATGIRAVGVTVPLPIRTNVINLEAAYAAAHPALTFLGLELLDNGPWQVRNNTVYGYPTAVRAVDANVSFQNNIVWAPTPLATPFVYVNSPQHQVIYNDINYTGGFEPGSGNFASDPLFVDVVADNFHLTYNSPCIDTGNPAQLPDEDGSLPDIGAFCYLHKAKFTADAMFIIPNHVVHFSNFSVGHSDPSTTVAWDLNNDGSVEATSWDWQYQFVYPGQYTLKLTVTTGGLIDQSIVVNAVVVQDDQLAPPENFRLTVEGANIHLEWNPVTHYINQLPAVVNYYLIYQNDTPEGNFTYAGFADNGITQFTVGGGASHKQRFFLVIGFTGSRDEIEQYIRENQTLRRGEQATQIIEK